MGRILLPGSEPKADQDRWVESASGLAMPYYVATRPPRVKGVDLFCGAGGFSLGIMKAGVTVLAGMDIDPGCMVTYLINLGAQPVQIHYATPEDEARADTYLERLYKGQAKKNKTAPVCMSGENFPEMLLDVEPVGHFFLGDARRFTGAQILDALGLGRGDLDVVVGSPPCQGYSYAGKRNVMDPRNSLVFEFARLVVEMQPNTMVFENVPGILNMVTPEGVPVVDAFCRILEDGHFGTLDALRQSLLASSGAGAVVRGRVRDKHNGKPKPQKGAKSKTAKRRKEKQLALL